MTIKFDDFKDFIKNKRVALFGVNKDLINLLKYKKGNLIDLDYSITHIIDFTLDYRENIKALLECEVLRVECGVNADISGDDTPSGNVDQPTPHSTLGANSPEHTPHYEAEPRIITTFDDFKEALENSEFDIFLNFEDGRFISEDRFEPKLLPLDIFEELLKKRYDEYIELTGSKGEYNFKYLGDEVITINSYITNRYPVNVFSAVSTKVWVTYEKEIFDKVRDIVSQCGEWSLECGVDVPPPLTPLSTLHSPNWGEAPEHTSHSIDIPNYVADKLTDYATLIDYSGDESIKVNYSRVFYNNKNIDIKNLKPVFVIGSDYAVGKATFIREKYNGKDNILLNDIYNIFINPDICMNILKEVPPTISLLDNIARLGKTQKGEIFVKIEGRIEEFAFSLPKDRYITWANFHEFFYNPKFVIIIKDNENMEDFKRTYSIFKRRMNLTDEQIEVYSNNPATNQFELIDMSH